MSTKIGSFQSPGYPDNYTDGQLCSWKIRVPLNDTVLVSFTTFSMETNSNNDSLEYYTKYNGSYELVHRYHGDDIPAVVMSESIDVMFVFRSDNEYNSYGFRADYEIFPTKGEQTQKTQPPENTTTNVPTSYRYNQPINLPIYLLTYLPTFRFYLHYLLDLHKLGFIYSYFTIT